MFVKYIKRFCAQILQRGVINYDSRGKCKISINLQGDMQLRIEFAGTQARFTSVEIMIELVQ